MEVHFGASYPAAHHEARSTRSCEQGAHKQRRTYATTGDRIILDFSVNGAGMGQRAPFDATRQITGRVIGTAPIESIRVTRNDATIWERDYGTDATAAGGPMELLLSFHSNETPFHPGDAPRGWRYRPHATLPGGQTRIAVADLREGRLEHAMPVEGYPGDGITLRRVRPDGPRDLAFTFTDSDDPRQGDYYLVRVRQTNDAAAWSSPIWVGGYPPR